MQFDKKNLTNQELRSIYKALLLPRMIEEKMLLLLRQGKISKWFSGIGQEAIAVGATLALQNDEWIMPMHRNLGVFTTRQMPLQKLFMQWQGNKDGYSKGRERSFHFGSKEHFICGMISHLGPQLALADGVALAYQLKKENKVALAFTGEGATSEGDFHEALNVAAVWNLPVIFIVENNGYGLSTPTNEQYKCESIVQKAIGYGMGGVQIDGNNILTVYDTIKGVRDYCIKEQKPYLIECMTFRMRGHEEASGIKYVPPHLFEEWSQKDPVINFETFLLQEEVLTTDVVEIIKNEIRSYIDTDLQEAYKAAPIVINTKQELNDVFAEKFTDDSLLLPEGTTHLSTNLRFVDAIKQALHQSLQKHDDLIIMGQDIAEYGGAFKVTEGFVQEFGKHRIRNTPICESAIIGAALGLSLVNMKSVVEMQFADFVSVGFNQIVNNLAKIHYRWGQNANVVVRMPCGAGVGAGPFHSQTNEAWFTKVAGLKVVYPSTPSDAKGLLITAINDPNPVLFFEHKALYRAIQGSVPNHYYEIEMGKAKTIQQGEDFTIITYGGAVHWCLDYLKEHPNISCELIDLRTLVPLDYEAIEKAVKKTGKVLIVHEDSLFNGFGAEISAWISEHCFQYLDAPVMRCASLDTPIPFNTDLENNYLAVSRLNEFVEKLIHY